MSDEIATGVDFPALRARLGTKALSLPLIFSAGGEILAAVPPPGVAVQRIAILGSLTTDFIARAAACALALEGVWPVIYQAPFGSLIQEALDPGSALHRFAPDCVLLATDWRDGVDPLPIGADSDTIAASRADKVALFENLWQALARGGRCRILQHLMVPPPMRFCGPAERFAEAAPERQVAALNAALLAAGRGRVSWIETDRLAAEAGFVRFASPGNYYAARTGFDQRHLPDYVAYFRAAFRAAFGRAKKALVLDLDNTLWGGVIGDDGVGGITLGPGSPAGEAFADWQDYLRALRARGIVLAVCSKNDPEIAATGFTHPATRLAREDFAAFECSWDNKADGLKRIAQALNLGLDSLIFLDDNPAECDLVAGALPEVAVVPLGDDPGRFIEKLDAARWLYLESYTAEDLARAEAYAAREAAAAEARGATDLGSYLDGLAMRGRIWRPEEGDIARVAQLEQKTNQFNLTTRRFSEAEIRAFLADDDAIVLAFHLRDKFGDHGLVSTLIARPEADGETLHIASWLMSCRVFSRTAEGFILRHLLALARARGFTHLTGEYRPTAKNGVVADLYPRLGFTPRAAAGEAGAALLWERPVDAGDAITTAIAPA